MMISRNIKKSVELPLHKYPVVGLLGSRQVGKTTLARAIRQNIKKKVVYLRLFADSLVIIDEIQRRILLLRPPKRLSKA